MPDQFTSLGDNLRDPIEIKHDDVIILKEAIQLAGQHSYPLGMSTLQRWAKYWKDNYTPDIQKAAVRCIRSETPQGPIYKISREDFLVWIFNRKENDTTNEAVQDLEEPHETSQNLERPFQISKNLPRPHQTSKDLARSQKIVNNNDSEAYQEFEKKLKELENENFNLKIDKTARDQIISSAREENESVRVFANSLLKQLGALEYEIQQLKQLPPARTSDEQKGERNANQNIGTRN